MGDGNERGRRKRQAERGPGIDAAIPGFFRIFSYSCKGKRGEKTGGEGKREGKAEDCAGIVPG
jgi:hypothetical protein